MPSTQTRPLIEKTCVLCGLDCARSPRKKDEHGRYAHVACLDRKKRDALLNVLRPKSLVEHKPLFEDPEPEPRPEGFDSRLALWRAEPERRVALWALGTAGGATLSVIGWLLLAATSGWHLGYFAVVVALGGSLVGATLAGGRASRISAGVVLSIVSLAVVMGRVAASAAVPHVQLLAGVEFDAEELEQIALAWLASDIAEEIEHDGRRLDWPIGSSPETASWFPEDFPEAVVAATRDRWSRQGPAKRRAYLRAVLHELRKDESAFQTASVQAGLPGAFRWTDLFWFPLGLGVAYVIAATPIVPPTSALRNRCSGAQRTTKTRAPQC